MLLAKLTAETLVVVAIRLALEPEVNWAMSLVDQNPVPHPKLLIGAVTPTLSV